MRDGQPPTDHEIKEYVEQILHGADLEQITMKMVCEQVYSHYPDFDLAHKKDFIKASVKSSINLEPTIEQMEKLVNFLEENPEVAKGSGQANNAYQSLQSSEGGLKAQKWAGIAKELNLMGGANRSGYSWAKLWDVSRSQLNRIIADRKSASGACGRITQPCTPDMMERMINLMDGLGIEEIPAESPSLSDVPRSQVNHIIADRKSASGARDGITQPRTPDMMERTINLLEGLEIEEIPAKFPSDDEIKKYVKQILEGANLEQLTMKMVCEQVYSHYPGFDLAHKKDFIKATVKSCI